MNVAIERHAAILHFTERALVRGDVVLDVFNFVAEFVDGFSFLELVELAMQLVDLSVYVV